MPLNEPPPENFLRTPLNPRVFSNQIVYKMRLVYNVCAWSRSV